MLKLRSSTNLPILLILVTSGLTGCGGAKENTAENRDYPDFMPDATPASYARSELASNMVYPQLARDNGIEGHVILQVYLSETGDVDKVEVLRTSNRIFNEAAINAVRMTTFTPAMQNGRAVKFRMTIPVEFVLVDDEE